ncbi:hypothetical protein CC117_10740 [Parafrankia colletiae]|uniref:DUF222 domain-containing protein n=1 Tax=Parafrankia colletiae TaxID=573497 RepID=A0A1S1RH41_9ACTN|nr:DUF222 domain-containing protein [Parafrankia colletiae]MCK9898511.1 13E12 repeat family protein [Frankia sp. Cpl3]OHV44124.1 hypothetical protein CC117_10740 [Parafrankia colletiae]
MPIEGVAVDDIDAQVARLATVDPGGLPDSELALLVIDMRRLVDATEASWIRLLAEFDRRGLWQLDGARSAAAWLRRECRLVHPATTAALLVAGVLRFLPVTAEAFRSGSISFEHVRAIAPAAEGGRVDLVRNADPIFARAALWMNPRQMGNVVRTWIRLTDSGRPDPPERRGGRGP